MHCIYILLSRLLEVICFNTVFLNSMKHDLLIGDKLNILNRSTYQTANKHGKGKKKLKK